MRLMRVWRLFILVGLLVLTMGLGSIAYAADPVHWTYEGAEGPEHWGELSPDYALCSTGKEQSPINIPSSAPVNPANLTYQYKAAPLTIVNNGHTIQVNYEPGSDLVVNGVTYKLLQFHFHAHSENTKDGHAAPMEVHFVHQNEETKALAVVGVWMEAGDENPAYVSTFKNLPKEKGDPQTIAGEQVNAEMMLPSERTYYRYNGSLTTPPCSEKVTWLMLNTPIKVSQAQIDAYTSIYANTARPTQPMNARTFFLNGEPVPVKLPDTGAPAQEHDLSGLLVIVGGLSLGAGVYLRRRKQAA